MELIKRILQRIQRQFHKHDFDNGKWIDLNSDVFLIKAPYMEICFCGATRIKESKSDN